MSYCEHRPIFGTDLAKQPDALLEEVRSGLAHLRGQLSDIRRAYGWEERIEPHEGALTVELIALSHTIEEFRAFREKHGDCNYVPRKNAK